MSGLVDAARLGPSAPRFDRGGGLSVSDVNSYVVGDATLVPAPALSTNVVAESMLVTTDERLASDTAPQRKDVSTAVQRGYSISGTTSRPLRPVHNRQFVSLARWEGAVVEVFGTYFIAEVINLENDEQAMVEFELDAVSPADRGLCEPGGLFYWSVGYETKESGQRSRASVVRFRRLGRDATTT